MISLEMQMPRMVSIKKGKHWYRCLTFWKFQKSGDGPRFNLFLLFFVLFPLDSHDYICVSEHGMCSQAY